MAEETKPEGFTDTEAMFVAKKQVDEKKPTKVVLPRLFVRKDVLEDIEVEIVYNPINGELLSVTRPGIFDSGVLEGLGVVRYNFKFAPVTYEQMAFYKRSSFQVNAQTNEQTIDKNRIRSFLLINHLRETNMPDAEGNPVKIMIDEKMNNMTAESLQLLYNTAPVLLDVVMDLFEKKITVVR